MLAEPLVGQEQVPGVVVPAQGLLVGAQVMDAAMAPSAEPEAPAPHLLDGEPLAEPPLAVAMPGDEVVERQGLARPPSPLARADLPLLAVLLLVGLVDSQITTHGDRP